MKVSVANERGLRYIVVVTHDGECTKVAAVNG
jgi:hypothetical protein